MSICSARLSGDPRDVRPVLILLAFGLNIPKTLFLQIVAYWNLKAAKRIIPADSLLLKLCGGDNGLFYIGLA